MSSDRASLNRGQLLYAMMVFERHRLEGELVKRMWLGDVAARAALVDQLLVAVTSYKKAKRAKDKEESSKSAVRVQGKLPPSVVRLLIWKIIELCARYRQPPPKNLPELLRVLDDTDGAGGKQAEGYRGFNRVVREYAKDPDAKPSVIAARAKVTRAAVSQWSRYPGFWEFVVTSKAKKDESKVPEDERILGVDLVEDPLFMDLEDIE